LRVASIRLVIDSMFGNTANGTAPGDLIVPGAERKIRGCYVKY